MTSNLKIFYVKKEYQKICPALLRRIQNRNSKQRKIYILNNI